MQETHSAKGLYNRTCLRIHQAGELAEEILPPLPRQAADSRPLAMATISTGCYHDINQLIDIVAMVFTCLAVHVYHRVGAFEVVACHGIIGKRLLPVVKMHQLSRSTCTYVHACTCSLGTNTQTLTGLL